MMSRGWGTGMSPQAACMRALSEAISMPRTPSAMTVAPSAVNTSR